MGCGTSAEEIKAKDQESEASAFSALTSPSSTPAATGERRPTKGRPTAETKCTGHCLEDSVRSSHKSHFSPNASVSSASPVSRAGGFSGSFGEKLGHCVPRPVGQPEKPPSDSGSGSDSDNGDDEDGRDVAAQIELAAGGSTPRGTNSVALNPLSTSCATESDDINGSPGSMRDQSSGSGDKPSLSCQHESPGTADTFLDAPSRGVSDTTLTGSFKMSSAMESSLHRFSPTFLLSRGGTSSHSFHEKATSQFLGVYKDKKGRGCLPFCEREARRREEVPTFAEQAGATSAAQEFNRSSQFSRSQHSNNSVTRSPPPEGLVDPPAGAPRLLEGLGMPWPIIKQVKKSSVPVESPFGDTNPTKTGLAPLPKSPRQRIVNFGDSTENPDALLRASTGSGMVLPDISVPDAPNDPLIGYSLPRSKSRSNSNLGIGGSSVNSQGGSSSFSPMASRSMTSSMNTSCSSTGSLGMRSALKQKKECVAFLPLAAIHDIPYPDPEETHSKETQKLRLRVTKKKTAQIVMEMKKGLAASALLQSGGAFDLVGKAVEAQRTARKAGREKLASALLMVEILGTELRFLERTIDPSEYLELIEGKTQIDSPLPPHLYYSEYLSHKGKREASGSRRPLNLGHSGAPKDRSTLKTGPTLSRPETLYEFIVQYHRESIDYCLSVAHELCVAK